MAPKAPKKLGASEIEKQLKDLPEWSLANEAIQRTYVFKDFVESMGFVNRVAQRAEAVQHHPDVLIRWNKVTLTLSTHDCQPTGGVSQKDFDFAGESDKLAGG